MRDRLRIGAGMIPRGEVGMVVAQAGAQPQGGSTLDLLTPSLLAAAQVARQLGVTDDAALALFQTCLLAARPTDHEAL